MINRFINRLYLNDLRYNITFFKNNNNQNKLRNTNKQVLQLYHSIREDDRDKQRAIVDDIFMNGFKVLNHGYNYKGDGVYLAAHSRYSCFWGRKNVIICDIIVEPMLFKRPGTNDKIKRFISEIYSPYNNSEYVVTDPTLIIPRCYFEYDLTSYKTPEKFWTNGSCHRCRERNKRVKPIFRRCDCEQFPNIDPDDVIIT